MRIKALSVESRIQELRGQRGMLSFDLAVTRNIGRFAGDFMFRVTLRELANLEVADCDFKLGRRLDALERQVRCGGSGGRFPARSDGT